MFLTGVISPWDGHDAHDCGERIRERLPRRLHHLQGSSCVEPAGTGLLGEGDTLVI